MLNKLDNDENDFRNTPPDGKKYIKRLSKYINSLIDNGRLCEASYYFNLLQLAKKNSKEVNALGYKLAIRNFDHKSAKEFDSFLRKNNYNVQALLTLELEFFYSTDNFNSFTIIALSLLDEKKLNDQNLIILIELTLRLKAAHLIPNIYRKIINKGNKLTSQTESEFKKLSILHLLNTIARIKS